MGDQHDGATCSHLAAWNAVVITLPCQQQGSCVRVLQAEVRGQTVTWLVPHSVAQVLPKDVDFRVMLTFLDFYHTLLQFALFKLYHGLGLAYPPVVHPEMDRAAAELAGIMKELGGAQEEQARQRSQAAAALTGAVPACLCGMEPGDLVLVACLATSSSFHALQHGTRSVPSK
jgi:hypothetical protein